MNIYAHSVKTFVPWDDVERQSVKTCVVECSDGDDVRRKSITVIFHSGDCRVIVGSKVIFKIAWADGDMPDITVKALAISAGKKYFENKGNEKERVDEYARTSNTHASPRDGGVYHASAHDAPDGGGGTCCRRDTNASCDATGGTCFARKK